MQNKCPGKALQMITDQYVALYGRQLMDVEECNQSVTNEAEG
jgi:hypothetical protein